MPLPDGRLLTEDCAALTGIQPSDWRARVSRGHAPQADEVVKHDGSLRPVWQPRTIDSYLAARKSVFYLNAAGTWCAQTDQIGQVLDRLNGRTAPA
jgi:hypothetical protein